MRDLEKIKNQLRHLTGFKDLSDEELTEIALQKQKEWDENLDVESLFFDKKERKEAKRLLKKYLKEYTIETISEKNTLKQLIYLEILNLRLQNILNEFHKDNKSAPLELINAIHKNLNQILALKNSLGITKESQDSVKSDAYKALEMLKKKFRRWEQQNQASRSFVCPFCGQMILLRVKPEVWEAQKHPFFKDRVLYNEHLVNLYKAGKLTKEDVAKVLECSPAYVNWLLSKWLPKQGQQEIAKNDEK
ncbi:MAG: hypothetical protein J7K20_01980 [Thermodesulfobacterium sp.]|nr:hypothetical protein [Thermodesulfobacterium sp.]